MIADAAHSSHLMGGQITASPISGLTYEVKIRDEAMLQTGSQVIRLDIADLAGGIYFLKITDGSSPVLQRFIVMK